MDKELQDKLNTIFSELDSHEWEKRFMAIKKLEYISIPEVEKKVAAYLDDSNENVRYISAKILGTIGTKISVEPLLSALAEPSSLVRLQIVEALGKIGDPSCVKAMVQFMQDENDPRVKATMIKIAGILGNNDLIPMIIMYLNDKDDRIRANAVEALDMLGDSSIVDVITPFLKDKSNRVKANAAITISKYDKEKSKAILEDMLDSDDEWMRASACFALGEIGDDTVIEKIVSLIDDDFWVVSRNAIDALRKMGHKTISFIENKINHETNLDSIIKLIFVFGEVGDEKVLGTIMRYINHENGDIRAEAENSIEKIRERS